MSRHVPLRLVEPTYRAQEKERCCHGQADGTEEIAMSRQFSPGDLVIYRKQKHSTHPGPRAEEVRPSPHGEDYSYHVDKFWVVVEILPDRKIVARTRRGKKHVLEPSDLSLRKANWWERIRWRSRFPTLDDPQPETGE
jgi:hypothetical protein